MTNPEVRKLAAVIARLESRVNALSGGRLGRSSIEDAAIDEYDENGQLVSVIGKQWDGAHGVTVVSGPTPPVPGGLTLASRPTGVLARWDGTWAASATTVASSDHKLVEVHASATNTPGVTFETYRGEMNSARGGELLIPTTHDAPLYVWLVARAHSGKASAPSEVVGPTAAVKLAQAAIEVDWDTFGGSTVFHGSTAPTARNTGDLWHEVITLSNGQQTYAVRRWDGTSWVLVADQGVGDAILLAEAADAAAAARARLYVQPEAPTGLTDSDRAIWVDDNDGNRSYTWEGTLTGWVSRRIGNGAIEPKSLVASDVIATGTVTAALLEATLVLASTIVAGSTTAAHVEIDSTGLRLYSLNPDGAVEQSGSWGTGDDGFNLIDPVTKATTASLTSDGLVAPSVSIAGTDADGDGVPESGLDIFGKEFLEYFSPYPRGVVAMGTYFPTDGLVVSGVTTPVAIGELAFTAYKNRTYRITLDGLHYSSSDSRIRGLVKMRGTEDGSTPTLSNGVTYQSKFFTIPTTNQGHSAPPFAFSKKWSSTSDISVRLILIVERFDGAVSGSTMTVRTYTPGDSYFSPLRWTVEDVGPSVPDTFQLNNGSGSTSTGGTAPDTAKKQYTTTWTQEWGASFEGGGAKRTDTDLYQGYTSYYAAGGIHRSLTGLVGGADYSSDAGEIGKTTVQALTGATVDKVEVKLHCNHSYYNDGGSVRIGYHGELTEPAAIPTAAWDIFSVFFKRGETKWVELPSTTYDDWKSGAYRGVTLGPGDGSVDEYMRFEGADTATNRPALRITYTR